MPVYLGAVAPESLRVNITAGTSGVDLSTVTAATIELRKPGGAAVTWTTILSNQTSSTLTATRAFVAGDVDAAGAWRFLVRLTVPGGSVRTAPARFDVADPFSV